MLLISSAYFSGYLLLPFDFSVWLKFFTVEIMFCFKAFFQFRFCLVQIQTLQWKLSNEMAIYDSG